MEKNCVRVKLEVLTGLGRWERVGENCLTKEVQVGIGD